MNLALDLGDRERWGAILMGWTPSVAVWPLRRTPVVACGGDHEHHVHGADGFDVSRSP